MADNWNDQIIAEFRANGGKVGGLFEGATLLLLHTAGAKTGKPHINPVMAFDLDENWPSPALSPAPTSIRRGCTTCAPTPRPTSKSAPTTTT